KKSEAKRKDAERVLEDAKKMGVYRKRRTGGFREPPKTIRNQKRKKEDSNGPGTNPIQCILELAFLSLLVGVEYKDCVSQFYSNHNGYQDQESSRIYIGFPIPKWQHKNCLAGFAGILDVLSTMGSSQKQWVGIGRLNTRLLRSCESMGVCGKGLGEVGCKGNYWKGR
nr:hypothetical protein [Tanacetum cinerariifolium]